jgi:very-short-patch-repair endonuclease
MHDLDPSLAAIAARQHGTIARRQVVELGGDRRLVARRVAAGRWLRLSRDVVAVAGSPPTWRRAAWALHLEAGPRSALRGASAAALLGLLDRWPDALEVVVPRGHDHHTTLGRVREAATLPAEHVTMVEGLACTTVARTVFDLAGDPPANLRSPTGRPFHAQHVERLVDRALARRLVTVAQLRAVLDDVGARGRPGTAVLRDLLQGWAAGHVPTESELEGRFLQLCRDHGLPEPRPQVRLGAHAVIGRVDFAYLDAGLVVELDGAAFHDGPLEREADRRRDNELAALGLRVLRLRWADVTERPEAVAALVRAALAAAAGTTRRRRAA